MKFRRRHLGGKMRGVNLNGVVAAVLGMRLALGALFIQKLKHGVIWWGILEQHRHQHKERFAQLRGATLAR